MRILKAILFGILEVCLFPLALLVTVVGFMAVAALFGSGCVEDPYTDFTQSGLYGVRYTEECNVDEADEALGFLVLEYPGYPRTPGLEGLFVKCTLDSYLETEGLYNGSFHIAVVPIGEAPSMADSSLQHEAAHHLNRPWRNHPPEIFGQNGAVQRARNRARGLR